MPERGGTCGRSMSSATTAPAAHGAQRPGLDQLRDAVASAALAALDRVLVTALDRLARTYVHQMVLLEELERHGCQVDFLERPMSQDPHDHLLLQIRSALAEYERTLIGERLRRGRLRKLQAGVLLPWTRPPYALRLDGSAATRSGWGTGGGSRGSGSARAVRAVLGAGRQPGGLGQAPLHIGRADPDRQALLASQHDPADPDQSGLHRPGLRWAPPYAACRGALVGAASGRPARGK
jgi:Resolvase, N terminal domain